MKQLALCLPGELARELEQFAPRRARERAVFLRDAIRKALDEVAEERMAAAYRMQPDAEESTCLDPAEWQPRAAPRAQR